MSAIGVEESTTVLEGLDFDIVCAIRVLAVVVGIRLPVSAPCPLPAAWLVSCRACGAAAYTCEKHVTKLRALPTAVCSHCRVMGQGDEILSFDQIAGK